MDRLTSLSVFARVVEHRQHLSTKVRSFIDLAVRRFAAHQEGWLTTAGAG